MPDHSVSLQQVVHELKNEFISLKTLVLEYISKKNSPVIDPPSMSSISRHSNPAVSLPPPHTSSTLPEESLANDMDYSLGSIESTILNDDALNLN